MHHGTCVTCVPWCMSGSLTRGGGENDPGTPGACATRKFTYLARGPWHKTIGSRFTNACITSMMFRCLSLLICASTSKTNVLAMFSNVIITYFVITLTHFVGLFWSMIVKEQRKTEIHGNMNCMKLEHRQQFRFKTHVNAELSLTKPKRLRWNVLSEASETQFNFCICVWLNCEHINADTM